MDPYDSVIDVTVYSSNRYDYLNNFTASNSISKIVESQQGISDEVF